MNARVAALNTWKGIPIPYFARIRMDNTPDFKVINESKRQLCAIEKRCWICGEFLERMTAFIGGPNCIAHRLFTDGPMHRECAEDALVLCPFMIGKMDYATDFQLERHAEPIHFADKTDRQEPPSRIGLLTSWGFEIALLKRGGAEFWFFRPCTPDILPVEWQDRSDTGARHVE